jgi:hypothetical protein
MRIKEILEMPEGDINKSGSRTKIIIAMLIAGVLIIAGFLYWHNGNEENTDEPAPATQSVAVKMPEKENMDAQNIAAMAAVSSQAVSGPITQRPDYVSETEWQMFQNVTKNNPDSNLTNLVNKLLFIKKTKAWLSAGENTAERRQLARQLLDMIPDQLEIEAIDPKEAKELEAKLTADLR